ncbi:MAG: LacI family DNA-binding transcriptional regulator [Anaerolineales bacterium]|nr:LacI family DNA-binding transcriptional regulator [Anaerolineales bacterium]
MTDENQKVTILDIAQKANVSPSTVSRVLRDSAGVAADKREAVLNAVDELNYRPNVFAQSLASGQSMTVGVLTQNFGSPFYDGILLGIMQGLEHTNYSPIFADGRWQTEVEQRVIQTLLDRRVDGMILVGGQLPEKTLQSIASKTPLIVVARELHTMPDRCVRVDNEQAAYDLTKYLIDMGHRDIVHITATMFYQGVIKDVLQRHQGYIRALQDAGIEPDPQLVVEGNLQRQSGILAVEMMLMRGRPFSAIFAANDQMASGARLALFRRGIRVPEDISLVGFDDESAAAFMIPPLTTVRQPARELGHAAADALLNLINGKAAETPMFQGKLIIRESARRLQ